MTWLSGDEALDRVRGRSLELQDLVDRRLERVIQALSTMIDGMEPNLKTESARKRRKAEALQVGRALQALAGAEVVMLSVEAEEGNALLRSLGGGIVVSAAVSEVQLVGGSSIAKALEFLFRQSTMWSSDVRPLYMLPDGIVFDPWLRQGLTAEHYAIGRTPLAECISTEPFELIPNGHRELPAEDSGAAKVWACPCSRWRVPEHSRRGGSEQLRSDGGGRRGDGGARAHAGPRGAPWRPPRRARRLVPDPAGLFWRTAGA